MQESNSDDVRQEQIKIAKEVALQQRLVERLSLELLSIKHSLASQQPYNSGLRLNPLIKEREQAITAAKETKRQLELRLRDLERITPKVPPNKRRGQRDKEQAQESRSEARRERIRLKPQSKVRVAPPLHPKVIGTGFSEYVAAPSPSAHTGQQNHVPPRLYKPVPSSPPPGYSYNPASLTWSGFRTIQFVGLASVGTLLVRPSISTNDNDWLLFCKAMGEVRVPSNYDVRLNLTGQGSDIGHLRDGDLQHLHFADDFAKTQGLWYVRHMKMKVTCGATRDVEDEMNRRVDISKLQRRK